MTNDYGSSPSASELPVELRRPGRARPVDVDRLSRRRPRSSRLATHWSPWRSSGSRTIRLKILHFFNLPRSWLAPVPAISKPEDRQLIIDRRRLSVQIRPILAKSVQMARQIRAQSGQRAGVYLNPPKNTPSIAAGLDEDEFGVAGASPAINC